jgi:DNA-binding CsgD family transcriptional regulator
VAESLELARPGDVNFAYAVSAAGLLELGLGRPEHAVGQLEQLGRAAAMVKDPLVVSWLPELVEASVRCGRGQEAELKLEVLAQQAERTRRPSPLAATARCRGLLAPAGEFESWFRQALAHHAEVPTAFERARTELCFGERLRRARRRADATDFLQSALATFEQLGARGWAAQARRELVAARGRRGRRAAAEQPRLTPRELQVAALVQRGHTNREVAAQLFVSEKAIEFHRGNIYGKLGLRSRTELARVEFAA